MDEDADVLYLAKYPFLAAAREYAAGLGFSLADLLEDSAHERSRRRAMQRVEDALRGTSSDAASGSVTSAEVELLSYPLSRAIVVGVGDRLLGERFSVSESKRLRQRLKDESSQTVREVAAEVGLSFVQAPVPDAFAAVSMFDFLRTAPTRVTEWKLVNQNVQGGLVSLNRFRAIRLVEAAFRHRLSGELEGLPAPGKSVRGVFGPEIAGLEMTLGRLHARRGRDDLGEVLLAAFPPCMTQIWDGIKGHVNIPHQGRFAIVSFLHKLGMDSKAILEFFSAVPDFDPRKSEYQIKHITGEIGGSTAYTPPTCQTMATYGICPLDDRDELCFQVNHPLTYYRRRYPEAAAKKKSSAGKGGETSAG